jgi:aminoglycoside 6'-N-acetyltransferase
MRPAAGEEEGMGPKSGMMPPAGIDLAFRAMCRDDLSLVARWLATPHVKRWWPEAADARSVESRYGPAIDGTDPTRLFVVEHEAVPIGMIQWYLLEDNPDWRAALAVTGVPADAAGIDYLIGAEHLVGRGIGPVMIDRFLDRFGSVARPGGRVVAAVDQRNRRSWRALEKIGFQRAWAGELVSDDPSDKGPTFVYVRSIRSVARSTLQGD